MTEMLVIIMGLAAMFGFFLGLYFFVCRLNLSRPLAWLGGIVSGVIFGGLLAFASLMLIWPPFSLLLTLGMMVMVVVVAAVILIGKENRDLVAKVSGNGVNEHDDMDVPGLGLDFDAGTRS